MSRQVVRRKPEVLLVDDEPSITEFLRCVFGEFDVREASGVCHALKAIEDRVPDAVVTDLEMDEGGGKYLLAVLADRFPAILRVIYSAAPAAELIGLTDSGLAHAAVQKSGDWSALRRALDGLVDRADSPRLGGGAVRCFGCSRSTTTAERLGRFWCSQCLGALAFEERLAASNGMFIAEVFLCHGEVGYVFAREPGRGVSRRDFYPIGLTRVDVVRQVIDAARAFRQSLVLVGDRVAAVNRDAPRRARELIDVATKHEALLAEDERRDIARVLALARSIAATVR